MSFSDKVVWITGASSGIGAALARAYDKRGASVVLSGRRADRLQDVVDVCSHPENHFILPLDVTREDTHSQAHRSVIERYGRVDLLINNAGISQRSNILDTQPEVERRIMEVNYFGTISITHCVLPEMVERRSGHIAVISSLMGYVSTPGRSSYAASKHALHGYFESLRAELWPEGINVTMICPGYVKTEIPLHSLRGDGRDHARMDMTHVKGMPADICAGKIVRAIKRKRSVVKIGWPHVGAVYVYRFLPQLYRFVLRRVYPAKLR